MYEQKYVEQGLRQIFGLDEVGRGPMAGPLVAGAVCLPLSRPDLREALKGVKDSKQMTPRQREAAVEQIQDVALAWGIGAVSAQEMPQIGNMTQITLEAMKRALHAAQKQGRLEADFLLIDYYRVPFFAQDKQDALKKGDTISLTIAAASVLAKVHRDALMVKYDAQYPEYGFAKHKGYPTAQHLHALEQHGVTSIHRPNYAPVQRAMQNA